VLVLAFASTALVAVVLALAATPWALAALPFCLVGGIAAWKGLRLQDLLDAAGDDDPGRGVPGLLP
jgi:hypothetical protein